MGYYRSLYKNAAGYSDPTAYKAIMKADRDLAKHKYIQEHTCVSCGKVIPEGRQVCPDCEGK